jgi:amino-acid N-acetyltransferase
MEKILTERLQLKIAVLPNERRKAIELLEINELPISDLDEDKLLYLLWDDDRVIGTGGLEIFDDCGLLRSVSVLPGEQGKGYGSFINSQLEKFAYESGIRCMYLLTTTARNFFEHEGYCEVKRENVPGSIRQSSEYSTVCPSTAVVMKKTLS